MRACRPATLTGSAPAKSVSTVDRRRSIGLSVPSGSASHSRALPSLEPVTINVRPRLTAPAAAAITSTFLRRFAATFCSRKRTFSSAGSTAWTVPLSPTSCDSRREK